MFSGFKRYVYDDDGDDDDGGGGEHSHRVGPAGFQFGGSLTIELRVAVHHRRDADQDLAAVALNHQLQPAARLLDQLPGVAEGEVLRHRAVDLREEREGGRSEVREEDGPVEFTGNKYKLEREKEKWVEKRWRKIRTKGWQRAGFRGRNGKEGGKERHKQGRKEGKKERKED